MLQKQATTQMLIISEIQRKNEHKTTKTDTNSNLILTVIEGAKRFVRLVGVV